MSRVTHQQLITSYKGKGFIEYDIFPAAHMTILCRPASPPEWITIIDNVCKKGRFNWNTGRYDQ